jgi:hypothetical protein
MNNEEKKQAALELLTLRSFGVGASEVSVPDGAKEMLARFQDKQREAMAELYAECFSDEQLLALLTFYGSELGRSIISVEAEIGERFREMLPGMASEITDTASANRGNISIKKCFKE